MESQLNDIIERYRKTPDTDYIEDYYYEAYEALGGSLSQDEYEKCLSMFIELTCSLWTMDEFPESLNYENFLNSSFKDEKNYVWDKWINYIIDETGNISDADLIFNSVDVITAYT